MHDVRSHAPAAERWARAFLIRENQEDERVQLGQTIRIPAASIIYMHSVSTNYNGFTVPLYEGPADSLIILVGLSKYSISYVCDVQLLCD